MSRNLSPEEIQAAQNLKSISIRHKKKTGKRQTDIAAELDITQSHFSQMVCGYIPITNIKMLKKLAAYFKVKPSDIRSDLK